MEGRERTDLHPHGGHIANGGFDVVGNPFDKGSAVLGDGLRHLHVHVVRGDLASEHARAGQIPVKRQPAGTYGGKR